MTCAPSHLLPANNSFGRPREYDRIKIVNDFIEYAKSHPDCLTVPCFASTIGITSGMMNNWANEDEENFRVAFNVGKEIIGLNRLKAVSANLLERSMYSQVIGNFDMDINLYQRSEKEFEAKLKTEEAVKVDAAFNDKFDKFNKAIEVAQLSSKALKSSEIKSNADAKS